MTLTQLKEITRELISRDQTKRAVNEILKWAKTNNYTQLVKDISLIKRDVSKLSREKNIGILRNAEIQVRENQIAEKVLTTLHDFDEGTSFLDEDTKPDEIPSNTSKEKLKILMLTANPANRTKLNLDKEHSDITQKLQHRQDYFSIKRKKAVSSSEFKEFTQQEQPDILHFSGHGEGGKYAGIVVQNDDKNGEELIPVGGLTSLFKFFKRRFSIKVVLLNACHTQAQAEAIAEHVDYVIGTNVFIGDEAASAFSRGFYFQLAKNETMDIEDAFDSGRTEAAMKGASEEHFVIYKHGTLLEV